MKTKKTETPNIHESLQDGRLGTGISLDIGCGEHRQPGFLGMDKQALPGVDVVHDLEDIPWPFPDDCLDRALISHILEHVHDLLAFMAEVHRVCKDGAHVFVSTPYWQSMGAWSDPTHVRAITENSLWYWDDRSTYWRLYKPPVFHVVQQNFAYHGNLEAVLEVIKHPCDHEGDLIL